MNIGKKFALAMGLAAVAATAIAPAAIAGVVSSNHDMIFKYTLAGATRRAGTCSFCHIPHKAGGDKLWASTYIAGAGWRAETISQLCYTCHGTGSGYAGALELNPFGTVGKHGRDVQVLTGFGDIAALPGTVEVSSLADADLKCTSCHDVHNNDSRPFLRYSGAGVFNFQAHCQTCHPARANATGQETANAIAAPGGPSGAGNYSQHPTDQVAGNTGDTDEAFVAIAAEFNIVPGVQGAGTGAWNLGGHRNNGLAGGNMTCATCHAVHGNETAVYAAADGAIEVAAEIPGFAHLEVRNPDPTTVSAAICTGCHANAAILGPGTVGVSHPIDTVRGSWSVTGILGPGAPVGSKWGANGGNVIVCQSCHDMHFAAPNTSLLRGPIDGPVVATSNSNCDACHSTSTMPNHHPAGVALPAGMGSPLTRTAAYNWATYAFGGAGPAYSLAPGNVMTCGTCHGGSSQAHNNTSGFPSLSSVNTCSDMCVDCHSTNPSPYTVNVGAATQGATVAVQASHYVGTIATAGYTRTANWGTTNLPSKYCSANTQMICESCHTLKINSGAVPGPTTSNNTAVAGVVKNVGLLLERNGNLNTVFNANITTVVADMCTGCHGSSPSGGTAGSGTATHPTISMGMAIPATAGIVTKIGTMPAGTVTMNSDTRVNCESCHRPHDAASGSGALILEAAGTASTKVAGGAPGIIFDRATGNAGANYTEEATFCNYCHSY